MVSSMDKPTNHELHIMLTKLDGKLDNISEKITGVSDWQEKHAASDEVHFESLNTKISNLRGLATSVGFVSAGVGVFISYLWNRFTGQA